MKTVLPRLAGLLAVAATALVAAAPVVAEPGDDTPPVTTVRLASVTYDLSDTNMYPTGRLTGSPVTGGPPITLRAALFADEVYLESNGWEHSLPDSVRSWNYAIGKLAALEGTTPPPPPFAAIGNTQELVKLATQLPPNSIVVTYGPDQYDPNGLALLSLQPVEAG